VSRRGTVWNRELKVARREEDLDEFVQEEIILFTLMLHFSSYRNTLEDLPLLTIPSANI